MQFQCPSCEEIITVSNDDLGNKISCTECKTEIAIPPYYLDPGFVIGQHIIRAEIGEGHYGRVFKAHQINLDRTVALKILHPQFATDSNFVVEFFKEARAAAALTHPNIVQSYTVNEEKGIYYQTFEYVSGGNLSSLLKKKKKLNVELAVDIMHQVAEALDFAWRHKNILHSDLKPENILLKNNGLIKVSDLGLNASNAAKYEEAYASQYSSPEEALKAPMDQRSEIYCMGILFYQLLAGDAPFKGRTPDIVHKMHLKAPPAKLRGINSEVPISLSRLISKMLAKHPDDRYQSFADYLRDLKFFKQGKTIESDKKDSASDTLQVQKKETDSILLEKKRQENKGIIWGLILTCIILLLTVITLIMQKS